MLRYRTYRRNNNQIGQVPVTTLRRWQRLEGFVQECERDGLILRGRNISNDDFSEFENDASEYEDDRSSIISSVSSELPQLFDFLSDSEDERSDSDAESGNDADFGSEENENEMFSKKLYNGTETTVGEAVYIILNYYVRNSLTKKALYEMLNVVNFFLHKPNNLPKTKYFLFKFIDSILPKDEQIVKKHRICENCSEYLNEWNSSPRVEVCPTCNSSRINGLFVEYDLRFALKDALEHRKLKLLLEQLNENNHVDEHTVSDITSATKYKKLKKEVIENKYDICLLWNTDGVPMSKSSNAQVWLVQAQVINIPRQNRRNYQFVSGIYYSSDKKPNMTSFLWPFVNTLIDAYIDGIDWYDDNKNLYHSKMIAPVATLDAPARAAVQNVMQFNGECGCNFCEHEGQTCETGLGHNRVFPLTANYNPQMRTKERMYTQAKIAIEENLEHVKGVKGPSVTALIPHFDVAESFVPDYMHSVLLGVSRMLFNLWFNSKSKDRPFYVNKPDRDEIDRDLKNIFPPDHVTRTPRLLKFIKYWKASELRECLLDYFPILLRGKLAKDYYDHFLLLVYAVRLLLQNKIHARHIEIADCLLEIFAIQTERLYGLEKCSFNVHQLTHLSRYVVLWGPLTSWSAFPFEDLNGFIKRMVHGYNKLDMEIANTLKILNAHEILKHYLGIVRENDNCTAIPLGKSQKHQIIESELEIIERFCSSLDTDSTSISVYFKIKVASYIITSEKYLRQKKRNNFYVFLKDETLGCVLYYLKIKEAIFAVIRQLICDDLSPRIVVPTFSLDFSYYLIPFRETYCIKIVPVDIIAGKLMRIKNYLCVPANMYEQK